MSDTPLASGAAAPPPELQPQPADSAATRTPPSLTGTLILAATIWVIDTQLAGTAMLSLLMLTVGNVILVVRVGRAWFSHDRPLVRRRLLSIAIYSAVALAAVVQSKIIGNRIRQDAHDVVAACERYRAREGSYPERLEQLVPRDLAAIPSMRRGSMGRPGFHYYVTPPGAMLSVPPNMHVLEYTSVPPFGKSFYVFETKQWGFRD